MLSPKNPPVPPPRLVTRSVRLRERRDQIVAARRFLLLNQVDQAAELAYKALVQDPQNFDAMLLAAEIEASRQPSGGGRLGRRD